MITGLPNDDKVEELDLTMLSRYCCLKFITITTLYETKESKAREVFSDVKMYSVYCRDEKVTSSIPRSGISVEVTSQC